MFIKQGLLFVGLLLVFMACDTRPDKSNIPPPPVVTGNPVPLPPPPPPPPLSDKPVSVAGVEVSVTCSCMGPQFTRDTYQSVDGKNKSVSVQSLSTGGALSVQQAHASCEEKSKGAWWRYLGPSQRVNLYGCTALITAKPPEVIALECACTASGVPQAGAGSATVIGVGLTEQQALHDSKMACDIYRKGFKIPSQCHTVLPEGYEEQNPTPPGLQEEDGLSFPAGGLSLSEGGDSPLSGFPRSSSPLNL